MELELQQTFYLQKFFGILRLAATADLNRKKFIKLSSTKLNQLLMSCRLQCQHISLLHATAQAYS